jgi:putative transport protein
VGLGAIIAALWHWQIKVPIAAVAGMFSGATTNTPSLAAGQTALATLAAHSPDTAEISGMAYAIAYPFGVVGIILTMFTTKLVFRKSLDSEGKLALDQTGNKERPVNLGLEVTNRSLDGFVSTRFRFSWDPGSWCLASCAAKKYSSRNAPLQLRFCSGHWKRECHRRKSGSKQADY